MSDKLTPKQGKAIAAILENSTIEAAAEAARVNPRTLYRWMRQDGFKQALNRAEGELLDKISRRLLALGETALDALADIVKEPTQGGAANKRMAASDILSRLLQLRGLNDIEKRLAALEAAQNDTSKR